MFALDLFNTDHERRVTEGAVDQLEQRRIDDLAIRMDDLVARAKTASTAEAKQALIKEFQKCKAERDSYYKVREGTVTPTATGLRHHAKPENYGGYKPEADPLARLDKHAVNRADKAMDIKFNREKKYQGGLDVDEADLKKNSKQVNEAQLTVGDPIVVTGPNEFEGKTGEIYELSPSGKFVIVDLYNHGRHSMHLSDVEYNQYADDQEEDDWYDEVDEGFQDFNKVEPYEVCLAGKPVKKFDYYEQARRFHDNWKQKLYREGNKAKADTITLMPVMDEAISKKDLLSKLEKDLNSDEFKNTPVDPNWVGHKGWTGPKPGDYGYTKNYGHGYSDGPSNRSHNRYVNKSLKKDIDEAGNPAQQAAIAIAKKKEQGVAEAGYGRNREYTPGIASPHAPSLGNRRRKDDEYHVPDPAPSTWYIRANGKIIKDKMGTPYQYRDKETARKSAMTMMGKPFNVGKKFILTTKPEDDALVAKGANPTVNELSTEKLAQYKTAAGADARAADKAGNYKRGDKRFSGIVKATKKQFANDVKKHPVAAMDFNEFAPAGDYSAKDKGIAEGAMGNLHAELSDVYNRMAPGIERNRDSFKAGQLYDALEAVAEQHGAEAEFKRMMAGARNRAHMDYDTNPGGFQNWFWYLPFDEEELSEEQNTSGVEQAILNRIMVAHTDLLMKFGPEKVMQAAEEVAYNVGDVDEIGTSDVSAYVNQVKQILGVEAQ
jgi:hypothetical protein